MRNDPSTKSMKNVHHRAILFYYVSICLSVCLSVCLSLHLSAFGEIVCQFRMYLLRNTLKLSVICWLTYHWLEISRLNGFGLTFRQ